MPIPTPYYQLSNIILAKMVNMAKKNPQLSFVLSVQKLPPENKTILKNLVGKLVDRGIRN